MGETYCDVTTKIQYKNRNAAERAKREFAKRLRGRRQKFDRDGGKSLEAFQCKHCNMWHIGHHMINTNRRHAK